jgi:glycosyltransferase involved in cell wall biosynthesis
LVIDGVTGLLAPVDDDRALARCLATLMDDASMRSALAKAGHEHVTRNYAPESHTLRVERIFAAVIATASRQKTNPAVAT